MHAVGDAAAPPRDASMLCSLAKGHSRHHVQTARLSKESLRCNNPTLCSASVQPLCCKLTSSNLLLCLTLQRSLEACWCTFGRGMHSVACKLRLRRHRA